MQSHKISNTSVPRPLPSFEGYLFLHEPGSPASPRSENGDASSGEWIQRWCSLEDGVIQIYHDHNSAIARPESSIRSIPLQSYSQLKASGDYDANGSGRWELILIGESSTSFLAPLKSRGIPRSSTNSSLFNAFERSAAASTPNVNRQMPVFRPRKWNESSDSLNERPSVYPSTWSNKFASKSKRLYQLMSGNSSTLSLSEQTSKTANDSCDSSLVMTSSPSNMTLFGMSSSTTNNNFTSLRQQNQPPQTSSTLILRANDARSMAQWAETISRCLGASSRIAPSPNYSPSSLGALPSHARPRRPPLASVADEYTSLYELPSTSSSLVSAAMASRRKREDSGIKTVDVAELRSTQDRKPLLQSIPHSATSSFSQNINQSRRPVTADKLVKSKRRASLEIFASVLSGRKSTEVESRPTTSSGASTRSSICCAGEAARISMERGNGSNGNPNGPFPSFTSPFSGMMRSNVRRSASIKSNRSSLHLSAIAPVAPSAVVAAMMTESNSYLDMNTSTSSAGEGTTSDQSPSTAAWPSPQTPLHELAEGLAIEKSVDERGRRGGMPNFGGASTLGLNLYYDSRTNIEEEAEMIPTFQHRPVVQAVIVESPTREDLATLLAKQEEEEAQRQAAIVKAPFQRSNKLTMSPSMPMLNRDFNKSGVFEQEQNGNGVLPSPSSLRFATLTKLSGRRPIFYPTGKRSNINKSGGVTAPPRISSPLQRPSTSIGIRSSASKTGLFEHQRRGSESQSCQDLSMAAKKTTVAPTMERILPPEEMIAKIDRLRNQTSTTSLQSIASSTKRSALIEVNSSYNNQSQSPSQSRSTATTTIIRPRTSPGQGFHNTNKSLFLSSSAHNLNRKFSDSNMEIHSELDEIVAAAAASSDWENHQHQLLRSLPAPPRLQRKTKFAAATTTTDDRPTSPPFLSQRF